jgi:predicted ATPase
VAAERFVTRFLEYSARHSIGPYRAWARCYHGAFLLKRGDVDRGLPLLRAALDEIELTGWRIRHSAFLGILAEGLGDAGAIVQGFEAVNEALARSERDEEHWCTAELLHVKGKLFRQENRPDAAALAEEHFHLSLDCARQQGALALELRAATSLARLWCEQHRIEEARYLLTSVYSRFVEGFGTADLVAAKTLLSGLK